MGKTLIGIKQTWNPSIYMVLYGIGGPWVEFLDFHLGFGYMKFQITNSSVVELFLDEFHVGF